VSRRLDHRRDQGAHVLEQSRPGGGQHDQGHRDGHVDHVRGEHLIALYIMVAAENSSTTCCWLRPGGIYDHLDHDDHPDILGCFVDWVGIVMLTVPLFGPIIRKLALTRSGSGYFRHKPADVLPDPPFGMSLFYLKSVSPPEVSTADVWKSASRSWPAVHRHGPVHVFPEIILLAPKYLFRVDSGRSGKPFFETG